METQTGVEGEKLQRVYHESKENKVLFVRTGALESRVRRITGMCLKIGHTRSGENEVRVDVRGSERIRAQKGKDWGLLCKKK